MRSDSGTANDAEGQPTFPGDLTHSDQPRLILDPFRERIVGANLGAQQLLGYTAEELASLRAADIHPEEMGRFRRFAESVVENGAGWTDELTCRTKSGVPLRVKVSASCLHFGRTLFIVAALHDPSGGEPGRGGPFFPPRSSPGHQSGSLPPAVARSLAEALLHDVGHAVARARAQAASFGGAAVPGEPEAPGQPQGAYAEFLGLLDKLESLLARESDKALRRHSFTTDREEPRFDAGRDMGSSYIAGAAGGRAPPGAADMAQAQREGFPSPVNGIGEVEGKAVEFQLRSAERSLVVDSARVTLGEREFRLLKELNSQRGCVVERDTLLERVWNRPDASDPAVLETTIHRLRKKLSRVFPQGAGDPLVTVRGVGYLLDLPSEETA